MYCAISLQTRRQLSCSFSQYMGPIPAHEREKVEYDAIVSHGDVQTFIEVRLVLSFDCALDGLLLLSLPLAILCSIQRHEAAAPYRLTPPLMPSPPLMAPAAYWVLLSPQLCRGGRLCLWQRVQLMHRSRNLLRQG